MSLQYRKTRSSRFFLKWLLAILLMCTGSLFSGPVFAADPDNVSFTLEGCKNDGTITLPNGSGQFICPDSAYTTGNLGKGWNELDLVPHRLIAKATNAAPATQIYTVAVVLDNQDAGHPGYDVLSTLALNAALSAASCTAPTVGSQTTLTPGLGGIDDSIYRLVTITQAKDTTCVYDYYGRLALGSHLFPGSSLHANLADENLDTGGIGARDVSIPVKEISPQELSKTMGATQNSDHVWTIEKTTEPAEVNFADTCQTDPNELKDTVEITIKWIKGAATPSGDITVKTIITAKNPAARVITVNVSDDIRSGTTVLDTATSGPVDVAANSTQVILTHTTTVPAGTTDLNDVATATYTDKATGVPVPGTTTATASATVQPSGIELNETATITDTETLAGDALEYSVDSFSGASGSFDGGYVAGTKTTGQVQWTSSTQSDSGSVTFKKTIYVTGPSQTNGSLSDTADLTGSNGFTAQAKATIKIKLDAQVSLKINKTISDVLDGDEEVTFTFHVKDSNNVEVATPTLTFKAGDPTTKSVTVPGLAPGTYTVSEDPVDGWVVTPKDPQPVTIALPNCSGEVSFNNTAGVENPARAQVKKVTIPAGSEAGWEFTLNGPGTPDGGEKVTTTGAGFVQFATPLQEGDYTITETHKTGWDQTGMSGDCSFTVNYPADAEKVFSCTYTNTARGQIIVKKITDPSGSSQSFDFTASYGDFSLKDGQSNNSGFLLAGTYSVSETVPTGWDLTSATCDDGSDPASIGLSAGEIVTCTFKNTQRGKIIVKKITDPSGSSQSFEFIPSYGDKFSLKDGESNDSGFLKPGTYSVSETVPTGWDLTSAKCSDYSKPASIGLSAGETVTCTFTNTQRGNVKVVKTVSGAAPAAGQTFTFELRQGASTVSDGTVLETKTTDASGNISFGTSLIPGQTYQICEQVFPGWNTNLSGDGPLFVPNSIIPPSLPNPNVNNLTVCTNFSVTSGQTRTFTVDNTPPPGGRALTIGFWKNWASCSSSSGKGQKPILDLALGIATAMTPNPPDGLVGSAQNAGSGWPTYAADYYLVLKGDPTSTQGNIKPAPDCAKAVNLLNKSTSDGKKKMASDPLFNMTAQLVGAELNRFMGAGISGPTITNIDKAVLLNGQYKFNGLTYSPKLTPADATKANCLATQLDNYNNGRPVSTCNP